MTFALRSVEIYEKLRKQITSDIILDPSLLIVKKFWNQDFEKLLNTSRVYYPQGLQNIEEKDYIKIYV